MVIGFKLTLEWLEGRSIKDRKSIKDTQKELSNKLEQMSSEDERERLINTYKFIGEKRYELDGCKSEDEVIAVVELMSKERRVNMGAYFKLGSKLSKAKTAKIYWSEKEKDFPRVMRMLMTVAEKRQETAEKRRQQEKRRGETPDERWVRLDKSKKQMCLKLAETGCLGRHLRPNHTRYPVRTLV